MGRPDFGLELAANITTRARRTVLFFADDDAEQLLSRFVTLGGDNRLIQFLPTASLVDLADWLQLWKPILLIVDLDEQGIYLLSRGIELCPQRR